VRLNVSNFKYFAIRSNHEWKWGAFAELIHNSADAQAKHVTIDLAVHSPVVLRIKDDGYGMDYDQMKRMLNIGHKVRSLSDLEM
jgi:DNA mismatch repair ATPase MutL